MPLTEAYPGYRMPSLQKNCSFPVFIKFADHPFTSPAVCKNANKAFELFDGIDIFMKTVDSLASPFDGGCCEEGGELM